MIATDRFEGALGTWTHCAWEPPPGDPLAAFVERIWDFDGILTFPREQAFPDGTLALVVQLDEPHRPIATAPMDPFPAVCFDGLQTRATVIEGPRSRCRVLAIILRPLGASALLGASLRELTDRSTDLHAISGNTAAQELAQRLDDARDGSERVRRARAWTSVRLARAEVCDPLVVRVFERIERGAGNLAVTQLEELSGRSRSRLCAAFADAIGLSPKRYARIVRFRRALELVGTGSSPLGDIALRCGYYDQAHMNAEFAEHAGLTPRAYMLARRYPESTHLVVP
jgi:AraC-like DNA-binding protein